MAVPSCAKPKLMVLASTYPRWADDHEPGFVHELARRLGEAYSVVVVAPHSPGASTREVLDGVDVVRYRYAPEFLETLVHGGGIAANLRRSPWKMLLLPGFLAGQYLVARRLAGQQRPDVVHAHWLLPQGLIAWRLRKASGIPYLVTSHGGDLFGLRGSISTRLKRMVARRAAAMTVVSTAMREESLRIGLAPPILEVLPMGVDLGGRFVASSDTTRELDRLLFVGRLVPKKGLKHLLDAMPLVLAKRPNVVLEIAGFGPEASSLEDQARQLGIAGHILFHGATPQRDLPHLYRRASLFVAPFVRDESGDQEGLPVALMEAIGCGCPVVVGDVAGVRDLLGEATDALCVRPSDKAALAAAILRALERPDDAATQAAALAERIAARVDWTTIASRYSALIERCNGARVKTVVLR